MTPPKHPKRSTPSELYERLLEEKDRTINILTRQLEAQGKQPAVVEPEIPMMEIRKQWISEEEEDLNELVENGRLTRVEAEAALAAITEGVIEH